MRLEAFKVRNLGPFRDFAIDLADYEGQTLIAVVGPNGAGKSTFLELGLPGAMYRTTPTRGSLQDLATARDAMLEVRVVNGKAWTLRHLVDPVSGKSEALVLDEAGNPVLDSSKVRDFDRWVERHLPLREVLFSSVFGAQGASGFLGMKPTDRKAVLLRALGLEHLEVLAAGARAEAASARALATTVEARLDEFRKAWPGTDAAVMQVAVSEAEQKLEQAEAAAAAAEREVQFARASATDTELAIARWQENLVKQSALGAKAAALLEQKTGIEAKLVNNRAVLADAEAIRAAVVRVEELRAQLVQVHHEAQAAKLAGDGWARDMAAAERALHEATSRRLRAETQLLAAGPVRDMAGRLSALLVEEQAALKALDALSKAVKDLEAVALTGAEGRIDKLRHGLEVICDPLSVPAQIARETLTVDDQLALTAAEHPAKLHLARADHAAGVAAWSAADKAKRAAESAAQQLPAIEALAAEHEAAKAAAAHAGDELSLVRASKPETIDLPGMEEAASKLSAELAAAEKLAAKAGPLANAEGRIAELEPQLAQVLADHAAVTAELAALPNLATPQSFDLGAIEQRLTESRKVVEAARKEVFAATAKQESFAAAHARALQVEEELAAANAEVADWVRLSADLGRDGLQAAEIDAAGPELTALVNDLLHTCIGPRWTVSIETTRLSADGKRQLEGCDVRVIDTENGRDAEASTYSGGERVVLGEAVSLALAMLSCRRAGLDGVTLVRDESGAALDPVNARAYVQMMRRAAQLVGARHVLFVSHSPEVVEMADAKIEVRPFT